MGKTPTNADRDGLPDGRPRCVQLCKRRNLLRGIFGSRLLLPGNGWGERPREPNLDVGQNVIARRQAGSAAEMPEGCAMPRKLHD